MPKAERKLCEHCGVERPSAVLAALCEALDGWDYASGYKGDYLRDKHGDAERVEELRRLHGLEAREP